MNEKIKPASSLSSAIKAAKAVAKVAYEEAYKRRAPGGHIAYREAELIPSDGAENRTDDPDYVPFGKLTAEYLRNGILSAFQRYPATKEFWICGGFDEYASFGEYMQNQRGECFDYEPRVENFDYQVPPELVDRVLKGLA